jgi:hypothetical protein
MYITRALGKNIVTICTEVLYYRILCFATPDLRYQTSDSRLSSPIFRLSSSDSSLPIPSSDSGLKTSDTPLPRLAHECWLPTPDSWLPTSSFQLPCPTFVSRHWNLDAQHPTPPVFLPSTPDIQLLTEVSQRSSHILPPIFRLPTTDSCHKTPDTGWRLTPKTRHPNCRIRNLPNAWDN